MNPELIAAVIELISLAVRLNRPCFSVFANYWGHVNGLDIRIHPRGYDSDDPAGLVSRSVYLSGRLATTPEKVREMAAWMRSLSDRAGLERCPRCSAALASPAPTPKPTARSRRGRDRVREVLSASDSAVTTAEVACRAGVSQQHAYLLLRRLEAGGEAERADSRAWRKPGAEAARR